MASGAGNGIVRLWKTEGEPAKGGVVGLQGEGDGKGSHRRAWWGACRVYGGRQGRQ